MFPRISLLPVTKTHKINILIFTTVLQSIKNMLHGYVPTCVRDGVLMNHQINMFNYLSM